jgi:hypothetical protein
LDCGFEFDESTNSAGLSSCGRDERPESTLAPELLFPDMTADEIRNSTRPISVITPGNDLVN